MLRVDLSKRKMHVVGGRALPPSAQQTVKLEYWVCNTTILANERYVFEYEDETLLVDGSVGDLCKHCQRIVGGAMAVEYEDRIRLVRAALRWLVEDQYYEEHPDDPHGDAAGEYADEQLDAAVRRYARAKGLVEVARWDEFS